MRRRRLLANKFQYNVKPSNISSPAGGLQLFVQSKKSDMRNCDGIPHEMSITPGNLTHLFVNPSLFHLCIIAARGNFICVQSSNGLGNPRQMTKFDAAKEISLPHIRKKKKKKREGRMFSLAPP